MSLNISPGPSEHSLFGYTHELAKLLILSSFYDWQVLLPMNGWTPIMAKVKMVQTIPLVFTTDKIIYLFHFIISRTSRTTSTGKNLCLICIVLHMN